MTDDNTSQADGGRALKSTMGVQTFLNRIGVNSELGLELHLQSNHSFGRVMFHNYFFPSGEQPKQRILAYKQNNQLPVVYQYFTNIAAI